MSTNEQDVLERLRREMEDAAAQDEGEGTAKLQSLEYELTQAAARDRAMDAAKRFREGQLIRLGEFVAPKPDLPDSYKGPAHGFRTGIPDAEAEVRGELEGRPIPSSTRVMRPEPTSAERMTPGAAELGVQRLEMNRGELSKPEGAVRSALRLPGQLLEGAGGTLEAGGALASSVERGSRVATQEGIVEGQELVGPGLMKIGRAIGDFGARIGREAFPSSPSIDQPGAFWREPTQVIAERLPETAGQFLAQIYLGGAAGRMLAGPATGVMGATAGARTARFAGFAAPTAMLETGLTYRDAYRRAQEDRGLDPEAASMSAAQEALVTGMGNTALEYLPFVFFLERTIPGAGDVFNRAVTSRIANATIGAATEGTEEMLQEAWGATSAYMIGKDPEAFRGMVERMAIGGTLGAIVGGGAGGVMTPAAPRGPEAPIAPSEQLDDANLAFVDQVMAQAAEIAGVELVEDEEGLAAVPKPQEAAEEAAEPPEAAEDVPEPVAPPEPVTEPPTDAEVEPPIPEPEPGPTPEEIQAGEEAELEAEQQAQDGPQPITPDEEEVAPPPAPPPPTEPPTEVAPPPEPILPEEQEADVVEPSPWAGATVEQEFEWFGTRVEYDDAQGASIQGTVRRVLNGGTLIEIQPEGTDTSFRIPDERVRILKEAEGPPAEPEPEPEPPAWTQRQTTTVAEGARTTVSFPGTGEKFQARYELLPVTDLFASHDPDTFAPRPEDEFPGVIQGRAYHGTRGEEARRDVQVATQQFDPDLALDPTRGVEGGPPTVTREGVVIAGNQRTMMLQRLFSQNPARAEAYRQALREQLEDFGIDPGFIDQGTFEGGDELVLVRVLDDESLDTTDVDVLRRLNAASDVARGKTKDVLSDAATRASQLMEADDALRHFGETIGDDQTLNAYLDTTSGRTFMRMLIEDGVIPQSERARFMESTGYATTEGKQMVERMMMMAAIGDADAVARAPASFVQKLSTSLPGLLRASKVGGEWHMGSLLTEAFDFINEARAAGLTPAEQVQQVNLLEQPDPAATALAVWLDETKKVDVKRAFQRYGQMAQEAVGQATTHDMFGRAPVTANEARKAIFDLPPYTPKAPAPQPRQQEPRQRDSEPSDRPRQPRREPKVQSKRADDLRSKLLKRAQSLGIQQQEDGGEDVRGFPSKPAGGLDAEFRAIGQELTQVYLEEGEAKDFVTVMQDIAADLGIDMAVLRPYLRSWYTGARLAIEDSGGDVTGMDDPEAVRAGLDTLDSMIEGGTSGDVEDRGPAEGAERRGGESGRGGSQPGEVRGPGGVSPEQVGGTGAGAGRAGSDTDVVAEDAPVEPEEAAPEGPTEVVPVLTRRRVEPRPDDSKRRREEIESANDSPIFIPVAPGLEERRATHPRLIVETRSMAGFDAPAISTQPQSSLLTEAWGHSDTSRTLSDEQMDLVLRVASAWDRGHAFVVADDVGVGKTREFAGAILEAIARGSERNVYVTKNRQNVSDAIAEFTAVAGGKFPARIVDMSARTDTSIPEPRPGEATLYIITATSSIKTPQWLDNLAAIRPTAFFADEAHLFKNVQGSNRGRAWLSLHQQLLRDDALIMYGTATPGVHLNELNYLYGLKEWAIGGFQEWVDWKLGRGERPEVGDYSGEIDVARLGKQVKIDALESHISPAETEQIMRELKGRGKFMARDLYRHGLTFDVEQVDMIGEDGAERRERYDAFAELARDIQRTAAKFWGNDARKKRKGMERSQLQSYAKQLMFELRLPRVLELAQEALDDGKQVVVSIHSVSGDEDTPDVDRVPSKRLEAAINTIQDEKWEKRGDDFVYMGIDEFAKAEKEALRDRARELELLLDPVQRIQQEFGEDQVAVVTGQVPSARRVEEVKEFQSGNKPLIIISKAGKEGISLHDVNSRQRRMIIADYEWSADTFKQEMGRVDRAGQHSPAEIFLVASNMAGERKFAATIQARMSSLGATSKGSAESTGTEALNEFDMSGRIAAGAMRDVVQEMDAATASYLTSSKFVDKATGQRRGFPKMASSKDLLLDLQFMPVSVASDVMDSWLTKILNAELGEVAQESEARRTARAKGQILRETILDDDVELRLYEVLNAAGERKGVLVGYVTEHMDRIRDAEGGAGRRRRYTQFTEEASGEIISGLEVGIRAAKRIRREYGFTDDHYVTAEDVRRKLRAGEAVEVRGEKGAKWTLMPTRKGVWLQVVGPTRDQGNEYKLDERFGAFYGNLVKKWQIPGINLDDFLDTYEPISNMPGSSRLDTQDPNQQAILESPISSPVRPMDLAMQVGPPKRSPKQLKRTIDARPFSNQEFVNAVADAVAATGREVPFRYGHITQRTAAGIYKVGPEVIRIRSAGRVDVAIHEAGHAIEKILYGTAHGGVWRVNKMIGFARVHEKQLVTLGKKLYGNRKPNGGYKTEGFAEFFRLYISDPATAQSEAPAFYAWFEDFVLVTEGIRTQFARAQDAYQVWSQQGAIGRARAQMTDPAAHEGVLGWKAKARHVRREATFERMIDATKPLWDLAQAAEEKVGRPLRPSRNPGWLASALAMTHAARAAYMINDGMIDLNGQKVGESLRNAVAGIRNTERKDFALYLWSRRALALWTDPKGPRDPGMDYADAKAVFGELDNERFRRAAERVYEWNEQVLDYIAQASPQFAAIVEAIRERDPGDYVPLQRWWEDIDAALRSSGIKRGGDRRAFVKKLKGSGLPVKDPIQVLTQQVERMLQAAHERAVFDAILRLSKIEGLGYIIEELTPDRVPVAARTVEDLVDEINRRLRKYDAHLTIETESGEPLDINATGEIITFFAPKRYPGSREPIYPVWHDGRVRWYRLSEELFDALSAMDVYRVGDIPGASMGMKLLESHASIVRAGTTGLRATFGLVTNPLRDVQTLWLNTRAHGLGPMVLYTWLKTMTSIAVSSPGKGAAVGGVVGGTVAGPLGAALGAGVGAAAGRSFPVNEFYETFLRLGLEMAQPLSQDVRHAEREARRLFENHFERVIDVRGWLDTYRDIVQFPEAAPRVAELELLAKERGWKPGMPLTFDQSLAFMLAAKQVTTDFTAAGHSVRMINRMIPFVNAQVQGPRANIRAAMRPGQKKFMGLNVRFATRMMSMFILGLLLWYDNRDEEWYEDMELREKLLYWHVPFTRPDGRKELLRIPGSFEPHIVSQLPVMMMDAWYRDDPDAALEFAVMVLQSANPLDWPPAFGELIEQYHDRDHFWDSPIVGPRLERFEAEDQYDEYTTRAAIELGRILGWSPKRIDHASRGLLGPVANDLFGMIGGYGPEGTKERRDTDELATTPIVGVLFQRGGQRGTRSRAVTRLYDLLEEYEKVDRDWPVDPETGRLQEPEQRRLERLLLQDVARATTMLMAARELEESRENRDQITNEITAMVEEALGLIESGAASEAVRERFQELRRDAEVRAGAREEATRRGGSRRSRRRR